LLHLSQQGAETDVGFVFVAERFAKFDVIQWPILWGL